MMLLVVAVSFLLFAGSMLWRRQRYQEAATLHASLELQYQDKVESYIVSGPTEDPQTEGQFWFAASGRVQALNEPDPQALASFHARLKEKYQRAASHPWLIVELDPAAPER